MAPFHFVSVVLILFCCARADNITVSLDVTVNINCSDNKVIDITNITVFEHPTACLRDTCTVNVKDKTEIQDQCNGYNSCNISHLNSNCLNDYGYFSFSYTCKDILPISCDFEQGKSKWNVWPSSEYKWKVGTADMSASYNGPDADHTIGTSFGTYIYTDTSKGSVNDATYLASVYIDPSSARCLTFWYFMYGEDVSELSVHQAIDENKDVRIWIASTGIKNKWYNHILSLRTDIGAYFIVFKAVNRHGRGGIALDDIVIANKDCYEHDCNFDTDCAWSTNNYVYKWRLHNKQTLTPDTGPDEDHTTGISERGNYIYLEANYGSKGSTAELTIPHVPESDSSCLTFWYHMYGSRMGQLKVIIMTAENITEKWSRSGDQGNVWYQALIDISIPETYNVVFEGVRGSTIKSDIAIDDIYFIQNTCAEFTQALSHLSMDTPGDPSYSQTCINVKKSQEFQKCSNNHMQFYEGNLAFSPTYESCLNIYDTVRTRINTVCSKMRPSEVCTFNYSHILQRHPSCFVLNRLIVDYVCKDLPVDRRESQSHNSATVGGVIAGVIILACVVIILIFVFRRSKYDERKSKPSTKLQNNTVDLAATGKYRGDYTGNQEMALPNASGHVIQLAVVRNDEQQYDEIELTWNEEHTDIDIDRMTEEQTHPQYEYVDSEINGCIKRNQQDGSNVNCYPSSKNIDSKNDKSHYSFAKEVNLESNNTEDYDVLDPNKTGFNRSNVITDVEIDAYNKTDRSTNMENDLTTEVEDQYHVSKDGTYDASNNKRHKETENNVYSHTVDNVYDTSSHKRTEEENEHAYDHFFQDRSADDKA